MWHAHAGQWLDRLDVVAGERKPSEGREVDVADFLHNGGSIYVG
jgi:hypothetical protein